ncbi:MAG: DUF2344 domain-containing protein [Chloroflexota bacterium]
MTGPSDSRPFATDIARPAADGALEPTPPAPPPEARQRWRVTFARELPADDEVPTGRDYIGRWEDTLVTSGLPTLPAASGRPRIALGAPLPQGCSADAELLEFWLTELRPLWAVREGVEAQLPSRHRLAALENVWLGAPPLSGQVAAAEYVVTLGGDATNDATLRAAAANLLEARRLPRERVKSGGTKTYDLRPLLLALDMSGRAIRMRTRIHPELGTGRPEEVVAALSDAAARPIEVESTVRVRLMLVEELEARLSAPLRFD